LINDNAVKLTAFCSKVQKIKIKDMTHGRVAKKGKVRQF